MAAHQHLLYHIVFSTKDRRPLLQEDEFREATWAYMAGVVSNLGGHPVTIGGHFDHAHLLVRIPAKTAVADFVRQVKANTSKHVNDSRDAVLKFRWQNGYGAFTVSRSQEPTVATYIRNQVEHHRKRTFKEEYLDLLRRHDIEPDERYVWE